MKKVIKISLAVVAALLIFLNVSLNLNGNKVEGMSVNAKVKTALADGPCYYESFWHDCYCWGPDGICSLATCGLPNDCNGVIIEGK